MKKYLYVSVCQRVILCFGICLSSNAIAVPISVATFNFDGSFAADEPGVSALTAIDPLSQSSFITDTVFGETRTVYRFDGNITSSENAGLSLSTLGIFNNDNAYSVEMVFQFEANQSTWENIFGVSNRQSDNAFYVQPNNTLQVWPTGGGPNEFTFGEYHHVTLTNDGADHVTAYLDGVFQFDLTTASMNFSAYNVANPDRLIHFFADNVVAGGQNEFSDGRVALIRLYDLELTPQDVNDLGSDPFNGGVPVPSPTPLSLLTIGIFGLLLTRQRFRVRLAW